MAIGVMCSRRSLFSSMAMLLTLSSVTMRGARGFTSRPRTAALARWARNPAGSPLTRVPRAAAASSDAVLTDLTTEELEELDSVPTSFGQCITDAATATARAIGDGKMLLEVEFPPLATDVLDLPECSAYDVSKANVRLAVDFAAKFAQRGTRVAIMLPDTAEKNRAIEQQGTGTPFPNVTINSLTASVQESAGVSFDALFSGIFGKSGGKVVPIESADMYVVLVVSTQELPLVESLALEDPTKPIVIFNLKLDQLRGDLGLPAFPPKDLQYRFLSRVLPSYYLRVRSYSKSVPKPPYLINYQGALFRSYPGAWQTMLDTGNGRYRRVAAGRIRPGLGEFKVQLGDALMIGDEGAVNTFFRQGFKTSTWWEDDLDKEESNDWRS